jgi:hypothetical protein
VLRRFNSVELDSLLTLETSLIQMLMPQGSVRALLRRPHRRRCIVSGVGSGRIVNIELVGGYIQNEAKTHRALRVTVITHTRAPQCSYLCTPVHKATFIKMKTMRARGEKGDRGFSHITHQSACVATRAACVLM